MVKGLPTAAAHALLDVVAGAVALLLLILLAGLRPWGRRAGAVRRRLRILLTVNGLERGRLSAFAVAEVTDPLGTAPPRAAGQPQPANLDEIEVSESRAAARTVSWLVSRLSTGLPCGAAVLLLWALGLALVAFPLYGEATGAWAHAARCAAGLPVWLCAGRLSEWLVERDAHIAAQLLGHVEADRLALQVHELISSRASIVKAVHAERRRIERDLHDGVQQQLVALGLLHSRARRAVRSLPAVKQEDAGTPGGELPALLEQAQENTLQALAELREVAWRVYPAILDDRGLDAALSALAARSALPVRIDYRLAERLPPPVEPVAYFAVSEAVTNAVKHSAAEELRIEVRKSRDRAVITVTDNGVGGADTSGAGLAGLGRRIAAVGGEMRVTSPTGGPTEVVVELPCAS